MFLQPSYPDSIATYEPPDAIGDHGIYGVSVTDNKAYLACSYLGLVILDISNPSNPVLNWKMRYSTQCP